jgi:hypothetical protein
MARMITVTPTEAGWAVEADMVDDRHGFETGAQAEAAAHRMARALVKAGHPLEVRIYLRDGSLAGRTLYGSPLVMAD